MDAPAEPIEAYTLVRCAAIAARIARWPGEAMMRLRRVWLARIVKDPEAAARVRTAMRAAADA